MKELKEKLEEAKRTMSATSIDACNIELLGPEIEALLSSMEDGWFKVTFKHDKNQQGRSNWKETVHVFTASSSEDLHSKIDAYIKEKSNAASDRWYYAEMVNIEMLNKTP